MRRLACNWPWLSNTTKAIVVASEDHFSGSCIIALSYSTERMVAPGDWHWPHSASHSDTDGTPVSPVSQIEHVTYTYIVFFF